MSPTAARRGREIARRLTDEQLNAVIETAIDAGACDGLIRQIAAGYDAAASRDVDLTMSKPIVCGDCGHVWTLPIGEWSTAALVYCPRCNSGDLENVDESELRESVLSRPDRFETV